MSVNQSERTRQQFESFVYSEEIV